MHYLQVHTHPDLSDLGLTVDQAGSGGSGRSSLLDDMLSLVLGSAPVAVDVAKALDEVNHRVGVQVGFCMVKLVCFVYLYEFYVLAPFKVGYMQLTRAVSNLLLYIANLNRVLVYIRWVGGMDKQIKEFHASCMLA